MNSHTLIASYLYLSLLVLPSCDCTWIVHVDHVGGDFRAEIDLIRCWDGVVVVMWAVGGA